MTNNSGYALPRRAQTLSTRRKLGVSRISITVAVAALALGAAGAAVSPGGGLVFASSAVLALIVLLLWQENEPPLLLFPALYQWLTVSVKPLMSVVLRQPVNALAEFDIDIEPGIILGLYAVAALSIGMRLTLGRPRKDWNAALKNEAMSLSPSSIVRVALACILTGHALFFLMRYAGGASQFLYAMANIRFMGLFALAYWCFQNRKGFGYLLFVSLVEILIGITGFFSDFRTPIFVIGFAAIAVGHRPKARDVFLVGAITVVLVFLGSFWSEVKMDYRRFVSGGSMEQIITVPLADRVGFLADQAQTFDGVKLADGFDKLLRRQSYIDFLAATMGYVPQVLPHENGQRIGRTFVHIITPRILFPDKPPTEFDSDVTAHYTGLLIQIREGTSISIGYVGELYIDFGKVGAVIACLGLGMAMGAAYRFIRQRGRGSVLLGYGALSTVLAVLLPFETALIKYVGGATVAFIAAYILQRYFVPWLSRQLRLKAPSRSRLPAQVAG